MKKFNARAAMMVIAPSIKDAIEARLPKKAKTIIAVIRSAVDAGLGRSVSAKPAKSSKEEIDMLAAIWESAPDVSSTFASDGLHRPMGPNPTVSEYDPADEELVLAKTHKWATDPLNINRIVAAPIDTSPHDPAVFKRGLHNHMLVLRDGRYVVHPTYQTKAWIAELKKKDKVKDEDVNRVLGKDVTPAITMNNVVPLQAKINELCKVEAIAEKDRFEAGLFEGEAKPKKVGRTRKKA